jgi:hypothetical protein
VGGTHEFDKQMKHQPVTSCCIVRNNSIINSNSMYREVVIHMYAQSGVEFQDASKYLMFFMCTLFTITTMMHRINDP